MLPVLFVLFGAANALNPCAIDPSACLPLEDFEVNCTCILTYGRPINATDDVFMFLLGHQIPLRLFRQLELSPLFRSKLKQRLPPAHDFQQSLLEMPQHIIRNLRVEENMALFLINSSFTEIFLKKLANESLNRLTPCYTSQLWITGIRSVFSKTQRLHRTNPQSSPQLYTFFIARRGRGTPAWHSIRRLAHKLLRTEVGQRWSQWCDEGECNAIVHSTAVHNLTAGTYAHAADILQVIELRGTSLMAVSSVFAIFDIPKVRSRVCENKCTRFQPNDELMCKRICNQKMRFDGIAITGQMKRDFEMFVRASAVSNLREKYSKYLK